MTGTYQEGANECKWSKDSMSIVVTVGNMPRITGTHSVRVSTGQITAHQALIQSKAKLSAHGKFVGVQPHAPNPAMQFYVQDTTTGVVRLRFDEGLEVEQHAWHPTDDDILFIIESDQLPVVPASTCIFVYSMSAGCLVRTVESPTSKCTISPMQGGTPANDIIIYGEVNGQEVVLLADGSFVMPAFYMTFEHEHVERHFTFSPSGQYVAVTSTHAHVEHLKIAKAEVYDVSSGKLCFAMSTEVTVHYMRGYSVTWAPNSSMPHTLLPISVAPVVASPGRKLPASAQGLYVVSTATWKKSAAIPCRGSRAAIECLPDCCRKLWCNGEKGNRAVYSLITFAK